MLKTEFMFCLFVSFCSSLLDLVDAPGVFIMGCHAQHKRQIQKFVTEMDEVTTFYASFRSPTIFFFFFAFTLTVVCFFSYHPAVKRLERGIQSRAFGVHLIEFHLTCSNVSQHQRPFLGSHSPG